MAVKIETQNVNSRVYRIAFLTVFSLSFVLSWFLNVSLNRFASPGARIDVRDSEASVSFRWNPTLYRLLAVGHVPSSVDSLLLRFLVDGNWSHKKPGQETEMSRLLDLATDLDPAFFSLYTAGSNFLAVVRNDREGALKILEKGNHFLKTELATYPESFQDTYWRDRWRIPFILGYVYLFEFQNPTKAAEVYADMKSIHGVPTMVRIMAEKIQTPEGQFRIGMNALAMVKKWYENDEALFKEVENKERRLVLARDLYVWNEDFQSFHKKSLRTHVRKVEDSFQSFKQQKGIPDRDLFGGRIVLGPNGRIDTETENVPKLGVDLDNLPRKED